MKNWIWLDDYRIPTEFLDKWVICKDYDYFVFHIKQIGLENIKLITLDHDLGSTAMKEHFRRVEFKEQELNYENIKEKTGYDCAKWLVNHALKNNKKITKDIYTHSANPVGAQNIISYINNYFKSQQLPQTCKRVRWKFKTIDQL